ncbi:MAG: helix-turn-helix transcriptional regulator [Actinomycetota bacterium]
MRPTQTSRASGSAVRRSLRARGLSRVELAARAGVGRLWLSGLETGKRTAELGRALSVLSALDLAERTPAAFARAVSDGHLGEVSTELPDCLATLVSHSGARCIVALS